ncbi:expressed unknown protein [Seminavis robusta]|uniref:Uncharacterized protein n=1 Tax=Seminavis robusta TaxID=568900 RepID=A0A9N8DIN4_9STRA|nr:expressed unknown protein [Seminavis robusta]|eukprot:Sro163_g073130.1 n/a (454) ;mRNA; f:33790-35230
MAGLAKQSSIGSGLARVAASTPIKVLHSLAELMSVKSTGSSQDDVNRARDRMWAKIPWENAADVDAKGEDLSTACDFSSFPSLSLQKKDDNDQSESSSSSEALFHHSKGEVEAHVARLLSRPILVANDQDRVCEEDEDEESFIAGSIEHVPQQMQQNLVLSFSTLVQSRLRAYATFLARHGLSVAACSDTVDEVEEGVLGVEQKLETLIGLGQTVSSGDVEILCTAHPGLAETQGDGEEDLQVTMPLSMQGSISVFIPTLDGGSKRLDLKIQTSGSITGPSLSSICTGIFSKASSLRVVQLDLDMKDLLSSMKEGANDTASLIVDMTNDAFAIPLPRMGASQVAAMVAPPPPVKAGRQLEAPSRKRPNIVEDDRPPIITPDLTYVSATTQHPSDLDLADLLEGDLSSLSPDKCSKIVDCVFDTCDVRVFRPPGKRARFGSDDSIAAVFAPRLA